MDPERFKINRNSEGGERLPTDPLSNLPPAPPPRYAEHVRSKKSKWWVWLVLVLVIVLGLAAWAYLSHKTAQVRRSTQPKKSVVSVAPAQPQQAKKAPSIPTTPYTSTALGLSFNYPSTWTVVDNGSAGVNVNSAVMNLTAANGQTVQGQIVMNVLKQGSLPTAFTASSVAVMTSQTVSYTQPSQTQAADTYISFVQYPSTITKGGLDGIYVTGNYGYQKDQTIPSSDVSKVDPLIYFSFYSCASTACPASTRQPLTIASTDWNEQTFNSPLLTTLKSFSFD